MDFGWETQILKNARCISCREMIWVLNMTHIVGQLRQTSSWIKLGKSGHPWSMSWFESFRYGSYGIYCIYLAKTVVRGKHCGFQGCLPAWPPWSRACPTGAFSNMSFDHCRSVLAHMLWPVIYLMIMDISGQHNNIWQYEAYGWFMMIHAHLSYYLI